MSDVKKVEDRLEAIEDGIRDLIKCDDVGEKNDLGGYDDPTNKKKAEHADLVTFPRGHDGTHCFNCMFLTNKEIRPGVKLCGHPEVNQGVTKRQCCKYWDNNKAYRSYGKQKI